MHLLSMPVRLHAADLLLSQVHLPLFGRTDDSHIKKVLLNNSYLKINVEYPALQKLSIDVHIPHMMY